MYVGRSATSVVGGISTIWQGWEGEFEQVFLQTILRQEDLNGQSRSFVNVVAGDNSFPKLYALFRYLLSFLDVQKHILEHSGSL